MDEKRCNLSVRWNSKNSIRCSIGIMGRWPNVNYELHYSVVKKNVKILLISYCKASSV